MIKPSLVAATALLLSLESPIFAESSMTQESRWSESIPIRKILMGKEGDYNVDPSKYAQDVSGIGKEFGLWMWTVEKVVKKDNDNFTIIFESNAGNDSGPIELVCWSDRFEANKIQPGQKVHAYGRLGHVDKNFIVLEYCDFGRVGLRGRWENIEQ